MNDRKFFVCILACLGLFSGCSDDSASLSSSESMRCTIEGAKVCSPGGGVLTCTSGQYILSSCDAGLTCHNGECAKSCTPENYAPRCDGDDSHYVCSGDGYIVSEKCAEGSICHEGYCRLNPLTQCDGSYKQVCSGEDGILHCLMGYVVYDKCGENQFCDNDICIQKVSCDEATFEPRCNNASEQVVCSNGYQHFVKCEDGSCVNGKCSKSCDPGYKACSSDGKTAMQCVGGEIVKTFCEGNTCADGECHDPEYCLADEYQSSCVDGKIKHCVSGTVVIEECQGYLECYNGACVSDGPCDKNMTPICLSDSQVQSCSDSGNKSITSCESGEVCVNGVCQKGNESCTDESKTCESANVYRNCVDGKWVSGYCDVASEVCIAGVCTPKTDTETCSILEKDSCDESSVVSCEYGYRVKRECAAEQVCVDGLCQDSVPSEPPKPGDDCESTTFESMCLNDGNTTACVDGKVVSISCGDSKVCKSGACVDKTCDSSNFVPECSGDFEITVCVDGKIEKESCGENKHCSNNACVDDANVDDPCNPKTFSPTCTSEGKVLTCDGETLKVKATECSGDTPACLNGVCVACDPSKYEAHCTDGHKYSCEANGSLTDMLCKVGDVCYNGDCAECDPTKTAATCSDGKVRVCSSKGIYEDSACPAGYSCLNGACTNKCTTNADCADAHYVCDKGQCKFQAECTVGTVECDGTSGIKVCKAPGIYEKTACSEGQICRNGVCMGNECDPDTYGTQCNSDGKTPTVCVNGYIKEQASCAGICLNGACAECDSSNTAPTCNGEPTAYYCIDNKFKKVTCTQPQEYCVAGEGCISVCGKDYKPSCNSQGQLVTCDYANRKLKTEDCSFDSECVNGVCEEIVGKSCTPASYSNKCHEVSGVTYVEYCDKSTEKVVISSCSGTNQFCGTVNGETNCFATCSEAQLAQDLTWCSTWWDSRQYIGKCFAGKDYKGATKYGILRQSGLCTDNVSISCRVDKTTGHNDHVVFDYLPCDMMGSTCSNGSCGFAPCGSLSSVCDGNTAKNCAYDPTYDSGVGGNVYYEMNCTTLGGTCRVMNHDGVTRALCDKSAGNFTGIGAVSTLGTCSNGALHTLYFGNSTGTSYGAHSLQCHNQCVTETNNGATYSYCK